MKAPDTRDPRFESGSNMILSIVPLTGVPRNLIILSVGWIGFYFVYITDVIPWNPDNSTSIFI